MLLGVRFYVNHSITGNEPHYLLMTHSLVYDHDLDLKNNYMNGDPRLFYPGLSPERQIGNQQIEHHASKWYSIHGIGLPLLLAPVYVLAGEKGAVVFMVFVASCVIWLTWLWALDVTKSQKLAAFSVGTLAISYFFNGLAGYLYPDMIIVGLTLASLILINRYWDKLLLQVLLGLMLGLMILIHFKSFAVAVPLGIAITYKLWREERKLPLLVVLGATPFLGYFLLSTHIWFGVWDPINIYAGLALKHASLIAILSGILFDSMRGVFINNPVLLLLPVGLPIWYKINRKTFWLGALVALPSMLILASFGEWQGGDAPIGRYVIDFLPIIVPAVGLATSQLKTTWQRIIVMLLALATLLISIDFTLIKRPYIRSDIRSPLFGQIERHTGLAIDRLLPTFSDKTTLIYPNGVPKLLVGYTVALGLFTYGYYLSRSVKVPKD